MRSKEINEFLLEYPHLIPFQHLIDMRLNGITDSQERMVIMARLLSSNLVALEEELLKLKDILESCQNE